MNTNPSAALPTSSLKSPEPIKLTPEENRLDELSQMAIHGTYAPGVTAKDLAAAKRKVYLEWRDLGGEDYESFPKGGDTVLHDAARSGHYPPDTTLELLAKTEDVELESALKLALIMCRYHGIALPPGCTGSALARLEHKYRNAFPSWLHYAATYGITPPDVTPQLLINTVGDGWTALHELADNGHWIPGITIRMLAGTVTPATSSRVANFSALEAFKKNTNLVLNYCSALKKPLEVKVVNTTKQLLLASIDSVPNLESLAEVRALAEFLQPIAPVETALWVAAELVWHQQKLINGHDAS